MDPALTHTFAVLAAAVLIGLACAYLPFRAYLKTKEGAPPKRFAALAAVLAFTALGVGAYAAVGRPALGDLPYEPRFEAIKAQVKKDPMSASPDEVLEVLAEEARRSPDDPRPLRFAGDLHLMLGESDKAIEFYQRALRVAPRDAETMLAIAQTLINRPGGPPPMVTAGLLTNALMYMKPDDPRRPEVESVLKSLTAEAMQSGAPPAPPKSGTP